MDKTGCFLLPHGFKAEELNSVLLKGLLLKRVPEVKEQEADLEELEAQLKEEVKRSLEMQKKRKNFECTGRIIFHPILSVGEVHVVISLTKIGIRR